MHDPQAGKVQPERQGQEPVDEFAMKTAPGEGTTVTLVKWTRSV